MPPVIPFRGPRAPRAGHAKEDIPMKHSKLWLPVAAAVTCGLVAPSWAQDPVTEKDTKERAAYDKAQGRAYLTATPLHEDLEDLIGAKVSFAPGADEMAEAARDDDSPDRPTGTVKDFLVCRVTGTLAFALVSTGGWVGVGDRLVAVPTDLLTWDPNEDRFFTRATEDQIEKLPAIDEDAIEDDEVDAAFVRAEESWMTVDPTRAKPLVDADRPRGAMADLRSLSDAEKESMRREHDAKVTALIHNTNLTIAPVKFVLASGLDELDLRVVDGEFGEVTKVIADTNARKIDFVVVKRGGVAGIGATEYLVPCEAVALTRVRDDDGDPDDDEVALLVPIPSVELENAVKYEDPDDGVVAVEDARRAHEWKQRICEKHKYGSTAKINGG
jgi:hypothetical protein